MEGVLLTLAVLACPVGMGLMMWFMGKGMRGRREAPVGDLDALRARSISASAMTSTGLSEPA